MPLYADVIASIVAVAGVFSVIGALRTELSLTHRILFTTLLQGTCLPVLRHLRRGSASLATKR